MIECDALRLIDEYIKSSSSFTTKTSTRSNSPSQNQFRLSQLSSSSCKNTPNNEELYLLKKPNHDMCMSDDSGVKSNETNVFSPTTTTTSPLFSTNMDSVLNTNHTVTPIVLDEELTRKNPNRPYSYYAATNFNPLDFAELINNSEQAKISNDKASNTNNNNTNRNVIITKNKSLFKTNSNNILSLSLSDFKASSSSLLKNKQMAAPPGLRTNPLPRKNKNSIKAYSYCDRDIDSKFEINNDENFLNEKQEDVTTNIKGQNRRSMALRFNRFIRSIFRSTSKNKVREAKKTSTVNLNENVNSNATMKSKKAFSDDLNENDDVFESTNQLDNQTNTNVGNSNRYSNLTENLRFSRLFGSFRKIGKIFNTHDEKRKN